MQFQDLNQFKPKKGERFIIVENGSPAAVLLSFEDYQSITESEQELVLPSNIEEKAKSEPEIDFDQFDFNEEESEEAPAEKEEDFLSGQKEKEEEKEDQPEEIDSDVKLDPEAKKDLTLEDLPF